MELLVRAMNNPRQLGMSMLVLAVLLTAWVYAPALDSKLYLDSTKLYQLERVFTEKGSDVQAADIGFGSEFGRIISQTSFYLNIVAADGLDIRAVKLTNVALHFLNAMLVYVLAALVLNRTSLAEKRFMLAVFIALAWLLSAVNLSGVVYAVQRMNELSATFSLLALIFYFSMRGSMEAGSRGAGRVALTIAGVTALTVLAYASKENGILVIVFIALIEFYFFPLIPRLLRKRTVLVATVLTMLAVVGFGSLWLVDNYWADATARTFSAGERLLTQCRILWAYIGQLILPSSLATGLFQDGYPVSVGLFTPFTTFLGLIGLIGLLVFALVFRADATLQPAAFGVAFFLGGHILESTALPLELYFEHRNYLPSFGLYTALVTGAYSLLSKLRFPARAAAVVVYFAFFVVMAHAKSVTWSAEEYVYDAALARDYPSPRAAGDRAQSYLEDGQLEAALVLLDRVASELPDQALRARLQVLFVQCMTEIPPDDSLYAALGQHTGRELAIEVSQALQNVLTAYERTRCEAIDPARLLPVLVAIAGERRSSGRSSWHIDYYVAAFYLLDDPAVAANWLEARFLEGEEAAGWMLLDLRRRQPEISVTPATERALDALARSGAGQ